MRKFILSILTLVAIVGTMSAQRVWAYGLKMESSVDTYTFSFVATNDVTSANLVFVNANGVEQGKVALEGVVAGKNTFTLTVDQIPGSGLLNWAVELSGAAIEEFVDLTADAADKYYFYLPQGVAVNNNPESEYFGTIYVAEPYPGAGDGLSAHSKTQTAGIYVFDPALNIENYAAGYVPSNVTLDASKYKYQTLHRIAVHPKTSDVVFVQSMDAFVWSVEASKLASGAEAVNLIANTSIWYADSHCFDADGTLYVYDAMATDAGGAIYKVVDGVDEMLVSSANWANGRSALASDGRGGIWFTQNRAQLDKYDMLAHVNAKGEIDFAANVNASDDVKAMMPKNTERGQLAYNAKEDVLALGGESGMVWFYSVAYDEAGTPTLTLLEKVALGTSKNVDGLAFDYAGDLLALSASIERFYKLAVPTNNNTCTTPAPKAQVIEKEETAVQMVTTAEQTPRKVMMDGQMYIVRGGKTYTALGQVK